MKKRKVLLDRGFANFYEKALFVKPADVAASSRSSLTAFCPSRYASIRTVSESTLFGGSVHYEIRLDSGY
ncbi:MAG TPA: hypothetical protein VK902_09035 [Rubrobacter sp.]|jgi:hypothetical protein|nr:hypothetical protein [Rubrobacter sp.]